MKAPDPRIWLAWLLLGLASLGARAGIADAPGVQLEVALITYGPGAIYWERFGHDAIELRDRASGEAVAFNYGMFDFNQSHFLLNFARGRMRYSMDAVAASDDVAYYAGEGRSVRRQVLALEPAQAARLRDALLLNLQPANAPYDYDYYRANCATRVRDALDAALDGQLRTAWQAEASADTYRSQTRRLMAPQSWLMVLMDLGLGPGADIPLSQWQADFVPGTLADAVARVTVTDALGNTRPLQASDRWLAQSQIPAPSARVPDWRWVNLALGLGLGLLIAVGTSRHSSAWRWVSTLAGSAFMLLAGLAGLLMLGLWTLSEHTAAWANQNLLLFNPLALALLPSLWRWRQAEYRPAWPARALATLLTAAAAVALLGKAALPWQQNYAWIALALPLWTALAWAFHAKGKRRRETAG
ncbi:MAG TPA: DUF4105 domain-containing protein [Rhodanobacteraceae bacterium]|nr:DUF4105 domain-containing protein [Rhodanobacteraceae bacterium]